MVLLRKSNILMMVALSVIAPRFAFADDGTVVTSKLYVDSTKVAINQGTGTNNENVGKVLVVGNDGNVALGTDSDTTYTASDGITLTNGNFTNSGVRSVATGATEGTVAVNTNGTTADVTVNGFANKQAKPASVANGQVLTYTGSDANSNVSASYIQVPVASGAPSSTTPTAFAEIWLQ